MAGKRWMDRLMEIDRRILFIFVAFAVILPLLFPVNLPIAVSPRVQAAYDAIDAVPNGSPILLSLDYEPDIMAELQPMSIAVLRHCFRKDLKPVVLTLYPAAPGLIERALAIASQAEGKKRNVDYVFLGYKSGSQAVILGMGESIRGLFPQDFWGTPLDEIPIMKGIDSYAGFPMVVNLSGSNIADYYIQIAQTRYHRPLVLGATAVMATDYYPYLSSKQLLGLIGGMKGAAEYERLIDIIGDARKGMDAQSLVHVVVVILVLLGNVAYLASGRRAAATGGGACVSTDPQILIAGILTLCVFSFLYRDNPFYRFAEHLFVGSAAGYLLAVQYQNVLQPNVILPLSQGKMMTLIPLGLGLILLGRLWSKTSGLARWALAFYVGIYSGIAVPAYLQAQIFAQLADAVKPFEPGWGAINSGLILIGFLGVLAYFFFSSPHRGIHGAAARIGIWFLMVAFGASFGYTVMARVSLLIARMQFMLRDFVQILPGA